MYKLIEDLPKQPLCDLMRKQYVSERSGSPESTFSLSTATSGPRKPSTNYTYIAKITIVISFKHLYQFAGLPSSVRFEVFVCSLFFTQFQPIQKKFRSVWDHVG